MENITNSSNPKSKIQMSNKIQNPNVKFFFTRKWISLFGIIKKIPWTWWVLLAIIIVGSFLRTYKHHDWLRFNADQGRDAEIVSSAVDGSASLPLLGPKAGGTQFRLGPAFYYFEIASAKIFGNSPDKMAFPDLFTGILCIPLLFFFLRKYFDQKIALSMSAIFAVSNYAIRYSRFGWNPNSSPFWTILFLYALHEVVSEKNNRKFLWAAIAGAAIGAGVQLHTTLLVILPITAIAVFAYFSYKNRKMLKYFFVILAMSLLLNTPQLVSEYQTGGGNLKAFFGGLKTKNQAESSILVNTVHSASCWIQGNLDIISGYEISDTCSFNPGSKAGDALAFLLGAVFVVGGTILGFKYFLKEPEADRQSFLGIMLMFTGITYLIFLKMAFELSVRFYLILIFLPFVMLGFWLKFLKEKYGARNNLILLITVVFLVASNLFFVQKYFAALANYGNAGGGSVDVVILKEAEVFSQFIVENSNNAPNVYIGGDGNFLFKGYKPIKYLVGRSNIDLKLADKNAQLPGQYFYVASLSKKEKLLHDANLKVLQDKTYGSFALLLVQNI